MGFSCAQLGWDVRVDRLRGGAEDVIANDQTVGRVIAQNRGVLQVAGATNEVVAARIPGGMRYRNEAVDLPTVGDWVLLRTEDLAVTDGVETRPQVRGVLPRTSAVTRKVAGAVSDGQVLAANVDVLLVVMAFGGDVNARRLERFAATAWESGAAPVLVLSKSDLVDETICAQTIAELAAVAGNMAVLSVSARTGDGVAQVRAHVRPGQTVAVIGSSGAGKSTLVNTLAGKDLFAIGGLRGDGRGRHTTVHRELIVLPGGEILIDTPGLRELQLWDAESGTDVAFAELEAAALDCRFTNCSHEREPGCAVRAGVARGEIAEERLASWKSLRDELANLERRQSARRASTRIQGRAPRR
jgi:ribosome biogenesis GTPase / thiamine phosphate phosphatase